MTALAMIRRTVEYDYWANKAAFDSLTAVETPEKAAALFGHILHAQYIWHGRLAGLDVSGIPVFPAPNLGEFAGKIEELHKMWILLFDALTDEMLEIPVEYRTTQGVRYSTKTGDILTHVFLHSAYHRGQIALAIRAGGFVPAITDFIAFARL